MFSQMKAPASVSLAQQFPKGRPISLWVNPELLPALDRALTRPDGRRIKAGTYCTEALVQRLTRDGHLQDDDAADVAAQAFDLSKRHGADVVRAKLAELLAPELLAAGERASA